LVLQRNHGELFYGKPFLYPLLAALPCRLLGANGMLSFNLVLLGAVVLSAFHYLRRFNPPAVAAAFALAFFGLSSAYAYVWWMHPEILQLTLNFFALRFWLEAREPTGGRAAAAVGSRSELLSGLCFGLAAYAKLTNVLLLGVLAFDLVRGPRKGAVRIGAPALAAWLAANVLGFALTGAWWSYGGERKRFEAIVPLQSERASFDSLGTLVATQEAEQRTWGVGVLPRNLVYFLFGRLAGYAIALLLLLPENYHGGGGAVGNRWFLNLLPGFLLLVRELRPRWPVLGLGAVGAVFLAPILLHPLFAAARPGHHATRAPFTLLPLELTLTVNWPTNTDPSRYRLRFEDHLVYLADYDAWAEPDGRLALRGAASAELALRGPQLGSLLLAEVENGPVRNQVRLELDGRTAELDLEPAAGGLRLFTGLEPLVVGRSRLLRLRADCARGGIPRYLTGDLGADHRYVGAYLRLRVAPERIVDRLFRAGRWAELAATLEAAPVPVDALQAAQAAEALRRLGRDREAARYRELANEQMPDLLNRLRRAVPASVARSDALAIDRDRQQRWQIQAQHLDLPIPLGADGRSAGLLLLGALPRGRYGVGLRFDDLPAGAAPELRGFGRGLERPSQILPMSRSEDRTWAVVDSDGQARWELGLARTGWRDGLRLTGLRLVPMPPFAPGS
jgi:hypothetical protein